MTEDDIKRLFVRFEHECRVLDCHEPISSSWKLCCRHSAEYEAALAVAQGWEWEQENRA